MEMEVAVTITAAGVTLATLMMLQFVAVYPYNIQATDPPETNILSPVIDICRNGMETVIAPNDSLHST